VKFAVSRETSLLPFTSHRVPAFQPRRRPSPGVGSPVCSLETSPSIGLYLAATVDTPPVLPYTDPNEAIITPPPTPHACFT